MLQDRPSPVLVDVREMSERYRKLTRDVTWQVTRIMADLLQSPTRSRPALVRSERSGWSVAIEPILTPVEDSRCDAETSGDAGVVPLPWEMNYGSPSA